jgi:hypothetical protein
MARIWLLRGNAGKFKATGNKNGMFGRTGALNPMFGKKHSLEAIAKMSQPKPRRIA